MQGLRPLGVGELLDAALKIYRSRARTLLMAVAVPVMPVVIFSTLVSASTGEFQVDPTTGELATGDSGDVVLTMVGLLVGTLATIVATSVATAACYRSISGAYVGDDPTWKESLRFGFSRLWSVLGLTFLTALVTVLSLLACLVGVLWPLAVFAVAMPAMLVEDIGAARSMGRSRELVKGSGWRVLGIVLLGTIIASVFQGMVSAPMVAVMFADVPVAVEAVVNGLFTMIATILVTPFTAALTMALYVDLRVRKEGFDLYLWANRLGLSGTGGFPAQPGAPELPVGWGPPGYPVPGGFPPAPQPPQPYGGPPTGGQPYPPQPYPPQAYPGQHPPQPYGPQGYPPQSFGAPPPPPPPPPPPAPAAPQPRPSDPWIEQPDGRPPAGGPDGSPAPSTPDAVTGGAPVSGGPDDPPGGDARPDGGRWGPPPTGPAPTGSDDPTRWSPSEDRGGWSG